jgi:hypothetical protein
MRKFNKLVEVYLEPEQTDDMNTYDPDDINEEGDITIFRRTILPKLSRFFARKETKLKYVISPSTTIPIDVYARHRNDIRRLPKFEIGDPARDTDDISAGSTVDSFNLMKSFTKYPEEFTRTYDDIHPTCFILVIYSKTYGSVPLLINTEGADYARYAAVLPEQAVEDIYLHR